MNRFVRLFTITLLIAEGLLLLPCAFMAYVVFVVVRDGENFWEPRYSLCVSAVVLLIGVIPFQVVRLRGRARGWARFGWLATVAGYGLLLRHVLFVFEPGQLQAIGICVLPVLMALGVLALVFDRELNGQSPRELSTKKMEDTKIEPR